ncbi:MAG TPA: hypothetical protein VFS08_05680 [Gemmatimonadaceae bacterium]|nr:hypothetical protein [Gemmatimonadaceae bacterium]
MSRKQSDSRGKQKGAQAHAEGQHGEKTHERFLEELHAAGPEERADVERRDEGRRAEHPPDGGHELFEGRGQHDPAERASQRNRLEQDVERHGHDRSRFEVRGGTASHPALPPEHTDPAHPDGRSRRR